MSGETTRKGYGTAHQRLRAVWVRRIAAGGVCCAHCGLPILPGMLFDLGHTDGRSGYVGPEHRHCNRAKAARKRNALARQRNAMLRQQAMWSRR
jgi:hypothetical protein